MVDLLFDCKRPDGVANCHRPTSVNVPDAIRMIGFNYEFAILNNVRHTNEINELILKIGGIQKRR